MDELTRRAIATDHAFMAVGHETFEADGASFVRDPAYPDVYDANHLRAVSTATLDDVERLLARADRAFAHCPQRLVRVDSDTPPVVEAALVLRGYRRAATLFLRARRMRSPARRRPTPVHPDRRRGGMGVASTAQGARLGRGGRCEGPARPGPRRRAEARIDRAKSPAAAWWLAYLERALPAATSPRSWERTGSGRSRTSTSPPRYATAGWRRLSSTVRSPTAARGAPAPC